MDKKKFVTMCDMASIKIATKEVSLFFDNQWGDGENIVDIVEKEPKNSGDLEFLGHFTVKKEKTVFLSSYDCDNTPLHFFGKGRWFVLLIKDMCHFIIYKCDGETHS